ncbi:O-antigen polymerase [Pannonibacter sp. SL95]|uniref:O-antigen polymerase n=1 Tax=Pannonibacter sp. SL95 TaxID=2995153 RepID=UPI0022750808|nr:O-antigen polymerase [Pannonibacter sp. SL95]MCY1707576.1 O-antigen ligase [Pannonibacter sp. SL95]
MNAMMAALLIFSTYMSLRGPHIFSPLRLWLATWSIAFTVNALLGWSYYYSTEITGFVFASIIMFSLGACTFKSLTPSRSLAVRKPQTEIADVLAERKVGLLILLLLLSCLPLIDLGMRSFSSVSLLGLLSSGDRMFSIMKENQAALYQDNELNFPGSFKLVTMILVFSAALIPITLLSRKNRYPVANAILLLIVSFLFSAASNVRSLLLVPLLMFSFSFVAACVVTQKTRILTRPRNLLSAVGLVTFFLVWIVVAQSARLGDADFERVGKTLDHMRPWFAGYVPALSVWYETYAQDYQMGLGTNLLRGLLGPLGLVSGEGFDSRLIAVDIGNGQTSNAMTIFRVLILDFGLFGTAIACYFWGLVAEYTYYKAIKSAGAWIVALSAQYCAVFFSLNYWYFAYGARIFGIIGAGFAVSFLVHLYRKKKAHQIRSSERRDAAFGSQKLPALH